MQELEDSLLAKSVACQKVTNRLQNHIDDEHDYFKKNDEHKQILQESGTTNPSCAFNEEIKTEQCLDTTEFSYMDTKKLKIQIYKTEI